MKTLASILFCILLCGCASVREAAIDISEEDIENAKVAREVAANCLKIWPIQSGVIVGALGPRIDNLPAQVVSAIEELDRLAEQYTADPNGMSDYALGQSLGLRIRLLGAVVQEGLEMYAPDVLDLIPLLF